MDIVEYYNFGIKFVFIGYHMRKLWSFSCSLLMYRTGSDSIIAGSSQELAVMIPISLAVKPRTDREGLSLPFSEQLAVMDRQWRSVLQ
jgi:hypothetical protein